jgi:hypothetical protein
MSLHSLKLAAAVAAAAAVTAAAGASNATGAEAALANCGTVSARGYTFHVLQIGLTCPSARSLTKKLARMRLPAKPVPYPGTYLKLHCFGVAHAVGGRKAAEIQCTGDNGRKTLIAAAR